MQHLTAASLSGGLSGKGCQSQRSRPCRGHKTMAALAAALESQWGEAHWQSGRSMALWSTHAPAAAPTLCWGPLSHPDALVRCQLPWCPLMILA